MYAYTSKENFLLTNICRSKSMLALQRNRSWKHGRFPLLTLFSLRNFLVKIVRDDGVDSRKSLAASDTWFWDFSLLLQKHFSSSVIYVILRLYSLPVDSILQNIRRRSVGSLRHLPMRATQIVSIEYDGKQHPDICKCPKCH